MLSLKEKLKVKERRKFVGDKHKKGVVLRLCNWLFLPLKLMFFYWNRTVCQLKFVSEIILRFFSVLHFQIENHITKSLAAQTPAPTGGLSLGAYQPDDFLLLLCNRIFSVIVPLSLAQLCTERNTASMRPINSWRLLMFFSWLSGRWRHGLLVRQKEKGGQQVRGFTLTQRWNAFKIYWMDVPGNDKQHSTWLDTLGKLQTPLLQQWPLVAPTMKSCILPPTDCAQ